MVVILEKIRQLNHLVQSSMEVDEDYSPLAKTLSSAMGANAYIIGRDGVVLGHGLAGDPDCSQADFEGGIEVTSEFRHQLDVLRQSALNQKIEKCMFHKSGCKAQPRTAISTLICNGKERLGYLVFTRKDQFQDDEMVLAEVGALAIGLVMVRHQTERFEADARQKSNVQVALSSLSFSEMQAISCVFNELDGVEGFLVASKIADRIGITRSVIVNAMRKLESAGIVESRSLGMKGTYIKVQNRFFLEELAKRAKAK